MTTAVFAPSLASGIQTSSGASTVIKRFVNALVESRIRSAEIEMRRHRALIRDLGGRQDFAAQFLTQDDVLPYKL
ncbi:hypothetical protein [Microvirga terricola]|uniref:Uncharacterized protein n=1 Tax=Microvirga terricola TaxID=2719797 RepID=A0ABX0VDL5_9HYPH|nr:hypothetical protein [Microvirga terricola]NIX76441.1 hypothetical protein [Microvirga terricola]